MTTQQWVDATLRLIGYILSWPTVTVVSIFLLRRHIVAALSALSGRARRASLGPVSVEFDQVAIGALQDTARQAAERYGKDPDRLADFLGEQISKMTDQTVRPAEASGRVLWADDNIGHNLFELHYVQRLGVTVETVATTEAALRALDAGRFDLVISDMHRVEDGVEQPQAGLILLREMRTRPRTPLVFYTSNAVLLRGDREVAEYGAVVTDTAADLFAEVRRVLAPQAAVSVPAQVKRT